MWIKVNGLSLNPQYKSYMLILAMNCGSECWFIRIWLPIWNSLLITALSPVTAIPTTRNTYFPALRFGYKTLSEEPKKNNGTWITKSTASCFNLKFLNCQNVLTVLFIREFLTASTDSTEMACKWPCRRIDTYIHCDIAPNNSRAVVNKWNRGSSSWGSRALRHDLPASNKHLQYVSVITLETSTKYKSFCAGQYI